ncbi:MAG: 4-(cytidine 5'-diphospho)-2-C-methyl-D-erythritol kinase [Bacteroidota bacterium]
MIHKAYAKINLGLRVLRKREDGFHDIETIFHRINVFDELALEPSDAVISISCDNQRIPTDENNLCWKAVELLRSEIGTTRGASVHIKKKIPIGAGLGGGSSDAATVLIALPSLWNISIDAATLADIALNIGSDVPFFLHNKSAYAVGRGERLSFVKLSLPYFVLVVTPGIHISTAWAYGELSKHRAPSAERNTLYDGATCTVAGISSLMENDFEAVVFRAHPEIARLKQELLSHGAAFALLSGSGSSVFGLFKDETNARQAEKFFRPRYFVSLTPPNFMPLL